MSYTSVDFSDGEQKVNAEIGPKQISDDDNESQGLITSQMIDEMKSGDAIEGDKPQTTRESDEPNQRSTHEALPNGSSHKAPSPNEPSSANESSSPDESQYLLKVQVDEPSTENDGQNSFISYRVLVKTDDPKYPANIVERRRRYSDFYFLYQCLINDYPTLLIPPLPDKDRLEYIKGGRFSEEYTTKRAVSLTNFLRRVCCHPIMGKSDILFVFLTDSDKWNAYRTNLKVASTGGFDSTQNVETVTDIIMNSFKKPVLSTPKSKDFEEIQARVTHLHGNLEKIDHIYSKVLHKQRDISMDLDEFGKEFNHLNNFMKEDLNGEATETNDSLFNEFQGFSSSLGAISQQVNFLDKDIESQYMTSLKDLEHYISQLKSLIKIKDSKILDYEMLSNYLEKAKQEKDSLINGGSITASAEGTISFLTRKFQAVTGLNGRSAPDGNITNERIDKLTSRIGMLETEKAKAKKIYRKYEDDLLSEYQYFNKMKNKETKESLANLGKRYLEFYHVVSQELNSFKADIPENGTLFPDKLSMDGKLFANNKVEKKNAKIQKDMQKIKDLGSS